MAIKLITQTIITIAVLQKSWRSSMQLLWKVMQNSFRNELYNWNRKGIIARCSFFFKSLCNYDDGLTRTNFLHFTSAVMFYALIRSFVQYSVVFYKSAFSCKFFRFFLVFSNFFQVKTKCSQICQKLLRLNFSCTWLNFWQIWHHLG